MSEKKRIIILANSQKPDTIAKGKELRDWLRGRCEVVADSLEEPLDLKKLPSADFIIVLGGDGTILATVRELGANQIPIIGVNMGKLGFLAEFSMENLKECFDQLVAGDQTRKPYTSRVMLNCEISGPQRDTFRTTVVNEIAVIAGPPFRMIEVSVGLAGEDPALCAGDGLIVATPTGSTAYNLSAGGPILSAGLRSAVITPLAAHSLSFRPIVVDLDRPIILHCQDHHHRPHYVVAGKEVSQNAAMVLIDGQINTPLKKEDQIVITRMASEFMLVQNPRHSQWQLLNAKLHWGDMPSYNS